MLVAAMFVGWRARLAFFPALFGLLDLFDILGRVLLEVLEAAVAAKFYLPAFVGEDIRLSQLSELFPGDHAGLQGIRFGFCGLVRVFFMIRRPSEDWNGQKGARQSESSNSFRCFHDVYLVNGLQ